MASDRTPLDNVYRDDKDCWTGVQDPKQRKKIQDRLAQRARSQQTGFDATLAFADVLQDGDSQKRRK